MSDELMVIAKLESWGVDCADAKWALRQADEWATDGLHGCKNMAMFSARALLITAAIRHGVQFTPRKGLATVATFEGRAYIGGSEADPVDNDPWLALVALCKGEK